MSLPVILAVDGGNSKTDLALVRADGAVLARVRGAQSSPHHLGLAGCLDVLQGLLERGGRSRRPGWRRRRGRGGPVPARRCRLSGRGARAAGRGHGAWLGRPCHRRRTTPSPSSAPAPIARWGVAIVCGAGINCVGVGPDGRQVRFPALGAITGDWGGGYDVGLAALSAAARSGDGRGPPTSLERAVPAHFGLETPLEVARAIHRGEIASRRLVELAPLVFAASATDEVAVDIVDRLAEEIVALARAALERLDLEGAEVDVVLGGGLIRAGDERLLLAVQRDLAVVDPRATVRPTTLPPARRSRPARPGRARRRPGGAPARARRARRRLGGQRRGCGSTAPAARRRRRTVAEVRFEQATRIYPGTVAPAVDALDLDDRRRRAARARRPVRIGQVDRAADAGGPRGGGRRRDLDRRPRRHLRAAEAARHRDGVPELRALPVSHGGGQHRLPAQDGEGAQGRARDPRAARWPSCWVSRTCSSASRASSPAASASASPWVARSSARRASSSWTSRCRTSTQSCACRCVPTSPACRRAWA